MVPIRYSLLAGVFLLAVLQIPTGRAAEPTFFEQRIAPMLKNRCLECHNGTKTRGGLDLSTRKTLLQGGDEGPAVVPGKSGQSLLLRAVQGNPPAMPKKKPPLTPVEVADLKKWIDEGALWPEKLTLATPEAKPRVDGTWWSLRALTRPPVPTPQQKSWIRTPIDAFILATLEAKGLKPSPEADRATLLRRLTFDLHGLPPTPEEIAAFVNDRSPDAYEQVVDRLLASPRYGERWGRHWLDVVHYGDTHGYDKDKRRDHAWPYRDYVINAFNSDKPYARFIKEQLAGDVLFPGSAEGVVATGFVTAGPWDFVGQVELREGTVDKLKTRVLDRDDMVSSTMGTFNSMTVHCARCHDHKFDPITQKDYYRLQAVFAGVERGNRPYDQSEILARRQELEKKRQAVVTRLATLEKKIEGLNSPELKRAQDEVAHLRKHLASLPRPPLSKPSPTNGYHSAISPVQSVQKWVQVDLGASHPIDQIILLPARPTDFPDTPGFGFPARFQIALADEATFRSSTTIADHTTADFANPGDTPFVVNVKGKKARYVRVTAEKLWLRTRDFVFALAELQVLSGGKNLALGARVTALDSIEAGRWSTRNLVDNNDSRRELPDSTDPRLARVRAVQAQLSAASDQVKALQEKLIDPTMRRERNAARAELATLTQQIKDLPASGQVYAVVSHAPRPIHILPRGDVEKPAAEVFAGALSCLEGLPAELKVSDPRNEGLRRAALAEWIANPKNVLTWRSMVNRVWHYHFGKGIVDTPNDFGGNGGRPTHPELLDWLAVEFRDNGGSLKKLHRLIVTSNTYRQVSRHDAALAKIDNDNRYLWRMNRLRLDAESVRDTVLAVSGKLDLQMGGPGFELFRFKDDHSPIYDHGDLAKIHDPKTYRRTVYRFTVRSVPNPFMESLDCADPNLNTPVRNTTLTALQALTLLNDPFMLRQAEYFAERLQKQSSAVDTQVTQACQLAFGRTPTLEERAALVAHARKYGLASVCRLLFNTNEFVFID